MKNACLPLAALILSVCLIPTAFGAPAKGSISKSADPPVLTTEQIAQRYLPCVVSITVKDANGTPAAQGSGVVIGPGMVVTNYHVVEGASSITINFTDGRSYDCVGVHGASKAKDVAILSMKAFDGPEAKFDSSLALPALGEQVVAIGNPQGLTGSISSGIVGGIRHDNGTTLIQTTAAISHGSSGGALVDMRGQIIGITSSYVDDSQNLNFAVSTVDVLSVLVGDGSSLKDVEDIFNSSSAAPAPAGMSDLKTAWQTSLASSGLGGLKKYRLSVTMPTDLGGDLAESDVEDAAASELGQTGVTLVGSPAAADAFLEVNIVAMQTKDTDGTVTGYSGNVALEVRAESLVWRPDGKMNHVNSIPYLDNIIFVSGPDGLKAQTVSVTKTLIDSFVKEYNSANP